jgi:hypothetical protein
MREQFANLLCPNSYKFLSPPSDPTQMQVLIPGLIAHNGQPTRSNQAERQNAAKNITHVRLHKRCYIRTACGQTQHYEKYVSRCSMQTGTFAKKQCRRTREQTDDPSANVKN